MNDGLVIADGRGFGALLRRVRWEKGLTEKGLAKELQEAHSKVLPLRSWVKWVQEVENGMIDTVDVDYVLAAAMALEVPMSSLLPVSKPSSLEEVGPTIREQLMSLGMPEEELCEIEKTVDLDGHGGFVACYYDAEDETDLGWDWEGP